MISEDPLGDAFTLLLGFVQKLREGEERQSLEVAAAASALLSYTGQLHAFEGFRGGEGSTHIPSPDFGKEIRLLERMKVSLPSRAMQESLATAIAALQYVAASGQREGLEDYLSYWRHKTLPPIAAAFKTHEEAEAWLSTRRPPPYRAKVLIGGEIFMVLRSGATGGHRFAQRGEIADFLQEHSQGGPPPVEASFETREEAEAWFQSLPEPPRNTFIQIKGEYHVAACWKNLAHRAILSASPRRGSVEEE